MFCVHGAQRAFGEQAECTQNKTEPAALAAATGNRKGAVAPLQCQGVWGRNAPNNSLNRTPGNNQWFRLSIARYMLPNSPGTLILEPGPQGARGGESRIRINQSKQRTIGFCLVTRKDKFIFDGSPDVWLTFSWGNIGMTLTSDSANERHCLCHQYPHSKNTGCGGEGGS